LASGIPARLSPAEGRKFGLTLGGAFLGLAVLLWWRGRHGAVYSGAAGLGLIGAGLLAPTLLGPVHRAWMGLAHQMSKVTTPIFMGVVYFAVLTPIGLGMRLFGRNRLIASLEGGGYWVSRSDEREQRGDLTRQF